jgi:hypothetical protein
MKSEWIANYENNEIKIINNWFTGEKLFVNGVLQDEQINFITPSRMTGNLINSIGEKLAIKVTIYGFFTVSCRLFIDNKKLELKQIV